MEPSKYPLIESDLLFSKRLESVQGRGVFLRHSKGRFRIPKLAMAYQKQERIDNVLFTCCILHNMVHTLDGMNKLENTNWVGSAELKNTWRTRARLGRRTSTRSLKWRLGTRCARGG
ncbi:unnamed protein product [Ascophyllum nodosum]